MALNWKTQCALPRLRSYTDAKRHYENVKPIRGDEYETRPLGRRDQKWTSIWKYCENYHAGYGCGPLADRRPFVTFKPNGVIEIPAHAYSSASTNERMRYILGAGFQTHQYDTWVHCNYYDNGELHTGWMPLPREGNPANFVMLGGHAETHTGSTLTYLNYTYPVTHKLNKEHFKEAMAPHLPFMRYVQNMLKLAGDDCLPEFSTETRNEAFGTRHVPSMRWGTEKIDNRAKFFTWAASDDSMDHLRATITLDSNTYGYRPGWGQLKDTFQEYLIRQHKYGVLDQTQHKGGKMVRNKYRRFLID